MIQPDVPTSSTKPRTTNEQAFETPFLFRFATRLNLEPSVEEPHDTKFTKVQQETTDDD